MYHGGEAEGVPGFPRHPHRGFETVTVVRQGLVDHCDSLGATARYGVFAGMLPICLTMHTLTATRTGQGDAQWLTTGAGICHSEMFPLVESKSANPMELFQIWINLPAKSKMTPPWFEMYWADVQPKKDFVDDKQLRTHVRVVGGTLAGLTALPPPPTSWAADPNNHVVIATLKMEPGATWTLPKTAPGINRVLYWFKGSQVGIAGSNETAHGAFTLRSDVDVELVSDSSSTEPVEFLLLQGRPINEPVVQQGPFVVNTQKQLSEAFGDYQRTQFGRWTFDSDEPTHPRDAKRFALLPDGTKIQPEEVVTGNDQMC